MRILHFSTDDISGGAAKASYRLHKALRAQGHHSRMIVRHKMSDDEDVSQVPARIWLSALRRIKGQVPLKGYLPEYTFNYDMEPEINPRRFFEYAPGDVDIICLHWITKLLTVKMLRKIYDYYQCPIVWMLMDQEPITGGCHYSFGCAGFTKQCGRCPQLNSTDPQDRSRVIWNRKQKYLQDIPIAFVSGTGWGAERVMESSLFCEHRVEIIPLAIDTTVFRPFDQRAARDLLHLPQDKKVVFFGATYLEDSRKGMAYLVEALHQLSSIIDARSSDLKKEDVFFIVAGLNSKEILQSIPFPNKYLGYFTEDLTLALAYQAANIFVCPSVIDGGPMMISESMLCGTPVVAFNNGIAPDLIKMMKTGYLAAYRDSTDLARGIYELLSTPDLSSIGAAAHEITSRIHCPEVVARLHTQLYNSLIGS